MLQYKFPKESLMLVEEPQIRLFEDEFIIHQKKEFIGINYNQRGYTVNDKVEEIIDSKIQTIGFFSGAGGLDIGAQLAGSKVISSLDFDRDSVATMRANKYFAHSKHFHRDIKEMFATDYTKIIKDNYKIDNPCISSYYFVAYFGLLSTFCYICDLSNGF